MSNGYLQKKLIFPSIYSELKNVGGNMRLVISKTEIIFFVTVEGAMVGQGEREEET